MNLDWLPENPNWSLDLKRANELPDQALTTIVGLANSQIDFMQTARLDRLAQRFADPLRSLCNASRPVRLAIVGSSTLSHLIPGIRIGALRRKIWIETYEGVYGNYRQEIENPASGLSLFKPDVLLISLDAHHLGGSEQTVDSTLSAIRECWRLAKQRLGCAVIHQTALPVFFPVIGNNEDRYPESRHARLDKLNRELRELSNQEGVDLLTVDSLVRLSGISEWHDRALWLRSKQEIHPRVAHYYGDHVARLVAALRGRSYKCLVLDLDNTLWGGVVGDDGLSGIVLGQGSALGEAHIEFQRYVLDLSARGIILAVCSKNDEKNAWEVFDSHPEMLLRRSDISCFVANWTNKATNLQHIAERLNIGIDSLVFADDNPFERNLVRSALPDVAVPELPEDPADFASCIAAAGYFESLNVTADDRERTRQYGANAEREQLRDATPDVASYLTGLRMELQYQHFDLTNIPRITQLINKTNQFNLTTRRYTESQVRELLTGERVLHLQFRLRDQYGDNGVIAIVIGSINSERELVIETWLMSCRVLGRQVEAATLNVIIRRARDLNAVAIVGLFRPTAKNCIVRDHYQKLGFESVSTCGELDVWRLNIEAFKDFEVPMSVKEGPK